MIPTCFAEGYESGRKRGERAESEFLALDRPKALSAEVSVCFTSLESRRALPVSGCLRRQRHAAIPSSGLSPDVAAVNGSPGSSEAVLSHPSPAASTRPTDNSRIRQLTTTRKCGNLESAKRNRRCFYHRLTTKSPRPPLARGVRVSGGAK